MTVPPGAIAQIRVILTAPHALVGGATSIDLDPSVFGDIAAVNVLSANGDQRGLADIRGRHVDLEFASTSGGIGRLPGVPVFTIDVPVLAKVAPGTSAPVKAAMSPAASGPWRDLDGREYSPNFVAGTIKVGGALSIRDVRPGGGMLPAGAVLDIEGTGFTSASTVEVDGIAVSGTEFIGPQRINVRLEAPAEMTGRRVVVRTSDDSASEYFTFLKGPLNTVTDGGAQALATLRTVFPLHTSTTARIGWTAVMGTAFALQNQTAEAVAVHLEHVNTSMITYINSAGDLTVPAGGTYMADAVVWQCGRCDLRIIASAPIRILTFPYGATGSARFYFHGYPKLPPPDPISTTTAELIQIAPEFGSEISWDWQAASAPPAPATIVALIRDVPTPVSLTTSSGSWLSVSPERGVSCSNVFASQCGQDATFTVRADPSSLKPGVYVGSILATPKATPGSPGAASTSTSVRLNVSASPVITVTPSDTLSLGSNSPASAPNPLSIDVKSSGGPVPFSVQTTTDSASNWLVVTPTSGTAPATLTVTADPARLGDANPGYGLITIAGPGNSKVIRVSYYVNTNTASPVLLSARAGTSIIASSLVKGPGLSGFSDASVSAVPPAPWLKVFLAPGGSGVTISADPTNLAPGRYTGTVDARLSSGSDWHIPVRLSVWTLPVTLSVSPAALALSMPSGSDDLVEGRLSVSTGNSSVEYSASTSGGASWLRIYSGGWPGTPPPNFTPDSILVQVDSRASGGPMPPGVYRTEITVTSPPDSANSIAVPVELVVTPSAGETGPPLAASLVNAASLNEGAVSPGEIVSIFGYNLGFVGPTTSQPGSQPNAPVELHGTRVLFDGIPTELLYSSLAQINATVPREVAGRRYANVELEYDGARVLMRGVPVAVAAPGVFTVAGTGRGPASVLNEDGSPNDAAHPATRGSTIQVFVTGLSDSSGVGVTLGSAAAPVQDIAFAPGMARVMAVVPASAPTGDSILIRVSAGTLNSQDGTTVSIQ